MNSVFFFFIELCDFKTKNLYNCLFDSYFVFPLPLFRNEQMICSFIITYIKPKRVVLPPVIYLICMTISSTSLTLLRMTNIKPWVAVCLCSKQTLHMWVPISLVEVCRAWDKYERRLMYGAPWLKMWMYWFSSWFTAGLIASISCWIIACLGVKWKQNAYALNFLLHIHSYGAGELEVLPIVGPGRVGKSTLVAYICKDGRVRTISGICFSQSWDGINCQLVVPSRALWFSSDWTPQTVTFAHLLAKLCSCTQVQKWFLNISATYYFFQRWFTQQTVCY